MEISPVGIFHCSEQYSYDVPRQGTLAEGNTGRIDLLPGRNFEQSLYELESFSRIWLIFGFHRNGSWKPMVLPPRHRSRKVGVFASRAQYRPNGLGLSCVELVSVHGLVVIVRGHDLLDGTPVYDIKPYLPYADAFPDASSGWTAEPEAVFFQIEFTPEAEEQLTWLERNQVTGLRPFIRIHLENEPLNARRNRLVSSPRPEEHILAYRTWRIAFQLQEKPARIMVRRIFSGYIPAELQSSADRYRDKGLHREFIRLFQSKLL